MDITPIINAAIGLIATIITIVLIPWIKAKVTEAQWNNVMKWANTAVSAAEALKLNGVIEDKFNYVIGYLSSKAAKAGYNIDIDDLKAALEANYQQLKASGVLNTTDQG